MKTYLFISWTSFCSLTGFAFEYSFQSQPQVGLSIRNYSDDAQMGACLGVSFMNGLLASDLVTWNPVNTGRSSETPQSLSNKIWQLSQGLPVTLDAANIRSLSSPNNPHLTRSLEQQASMLNGTLNTALLTGDELWEVSQNSRSPSLVVIRDHLQRMQATGNPHLINNPAFKEVYDTFYGANMRANQMTKGLTPQQFIEPLNRSNLEKFKEQLQVLQSSQKKSIGIISLVGFGGGPGGSDLKHAVSIKKVLTNAQGDTVFEVTDPNAPNDLTTNIVFDAKTSLMKSTNIALFKDLKDFSSVAVVPTFVDYEKIQRLTQQSGGTPELAPRRTPVSPPKPSKHQLAQPEIIYTN